ncbi:DUF998 domain-containing protein [Flavobacteriales bacterium]|jgi:hypothetical protein|nr:DUF998 domain-containing protein [Flavobacteriales bacterium]MDC3305451.1 DUF998 domain-containing protein [Flavobacteriales bacterium]MDG1348798.1 DUF998 domain-containing protein [Flavobacteriales bacterium]
MEYLKVKFLRRLFIIFCILLGIFTPLFCWYKIPDFNPINKPLSHFGVLEPTFLLWNTTLVFLAIGIFWNAYTSLRFYFKKKRFRYPLKIMLISSSISLVFTASISMEYELFHQIPAVLFFFSYNLFIFCFGLFRSFKYIRRGMFSIFIGLAMLFSTLLLLPFPSYGVFEIVYFALILIWNIYFLFIRIKEEGLKKRL